MTGRCGYSVLVVSVVFLTACDRESIPIHPPSQFLMPTGADPEPEVRLLTMGGLDAKFAVLEGVDGAGTGEERKWTADKARFRFRLAGFARQDFYMEYTVHDVTLHQTGPLRITIAVNGTTFDSFVKTAPGGYEYRRAAEAIGVGSYEPFEVSITVDPPYVAPDDGAKLGILLTKIGFVDRLTETTQR